MKIQIELLSDLCSHSGDTYNSYIDTDIVYDDYGFPYIPAKRIKGCIREACLELEEFGLISNKDIVELFGNEGKKSSSFWLDNAYLLNYREMISDLHKADAPALANQQKVLRLFTYTRTQTAIDLETGVADQNTLRTMRVAKKGLIFEANLTFKEKCPDVQREILEEAVRMVKHMGVARTRGMGLVELKLMKQDTPVAVTLMNENLPAGNDPVRLGYRIDLNAPVICKSEQGNQAETQDYISGSKVLGMLIEKIGQDEYRNLPQGTVFRVSNAYIGEDGVRFTPISKSLQKVKDQNFEAIGDNAEQAKRLTVIDLLWKYQGKEQLTPIGGGYVSPDNFIKDVDTTINYHHRRPDNKAIGRANSKDTSGFYQLKSISGGQSFYGFIEADRDVAERLLKDIPNNMDIRIGYGRGTEYGAAVFSWDLRNTNAVEKVSERNDFTIKLNSPVILYNEYGYPTASPATLTKYLQKIMGSDSLTMTDIYAGYTTIGGFNVTWNARKPIFTSLAQGTVCSFTDTKIVNLQKLKGRFIGERTREGYGEIEIYENRDAQTALYKKCSVKADACHDVTGYKTDLIPNLEILHEKQVIAADARVDAKRYVESKLKGQKDIDAVLGRLILMFRGEECLADFKQQIEGIETKSKKEISLQILGPIEKYIGTYLIKENARIDEKEVYNIYAGHYLGQIKYMIRSISERGGVDCVE